MEATKSIDNARLVTTAEAVYLENTLLRVFGILFCHDPKRARLRSGTLCVNK